MTIQFQTSTNDIVTDRVPAHAPHETHVDALPCEYAFASHDKHADEPAALNVIDGHGTAEATLVSPVALHAEPAGHAICKDGDGQYEPSAQEVAAAEPAGQYVVAGHCT